VHLQTCCLLSEIKHLPGLVEQLEQHDVVQAVRLLHIIDVGGHRLDDDECGSHVHGVIQPVLAPVVWFLEWCGFARVIESVL
jgi:hypothetical protein